MCIIAINKFLKLFQLLASLKILNNLSDLKADTAANPPPDVIPTSAKLNINSISDKATIIPSKILNVSLTYPLFILKKINPFLINLKNLT